MIAPSIARSASQPAPGASVQDKPQEHGKQALREQLLQQRRAMPDAARAEADAQIAARLLAWCDTHGVASLGVYHPIRREPDLLPAYNALSARGVHLALPVVIGADAPLVFRRWQPGDALHKDALGTLVPGEQAEQILPQALLVPCLGFTAGRLRLGYGGGFYDRTLALAPRPLAVGVCHAFGLVAFAGETHDIALDLVLTDTGTF